MLMIRTQTPIARHTFVAGHPTGPARLG